MKKIITILCTLLLLCACTSKNEESEVNIKELYPEITGESVFKVASQDDVLAMLENGTGVVFFSWIDCPWCHGYIDLVNDAALQTELNNVLYYDIYDDRQNNTEFYQKVIELVKDYVGLYPYVTNGEEKKAFDSEGKARIYVPMTIIVIKGEIINIDYSSSMESGFEENFDKYWNEEIKAGFTKRNQLAESFYNYFSLVKQAKDELDEQGCSENCKIG